MSAVIPRTPSQLSTWRTGRLGGVYLSLFSLRDSKACQGERALIDSQLEMVTKIIAERPFNEREDLWKYILKCCRSAFESRDEDGLARYLEIKRHYVQHILG